MRPFMDENFLLSTDAARELYADAARDMPILDYHCHLNPVEIAENKPFANITRLMLGADHYKWRLMRAAGEDERLICGEGDDFAKFEAFARTLEGAIGNPVYHWTHLELQRIFGISEPLTARSARAIFDACNKLLQAPAFTPQALIDRFRVDALCTTDDPADDLSAHASIQKSGALRARVLPAFRPDKAVNIAQPGFTAYMERLSAAAGLPIRSAQEALAALENRVDYFHARGARIADHGLETVPDGAAPDARAADEAFARAHAGETLSPRQADAYRFYILAGLGCAYARRGWAQQYHMAALRNNNARMFRQLGADAGFDSASDTPVVQQLGRLMDAQDKQNALPKTILYSLNGASMGVLAAMAGNFQGGGVPGKIQLGAAWWFLDTRDGITRQLRTLAETGLLSRFVGMLTDSRSFISYPRHEYFRRILCDLIGAWVENGEYPADMPALKNMVRDICYHNAKAYFAL